MVTGPAEPTQGLAAAAQGGAAVPDADRVQNLGELWRIKGSVMAVRQEVHSLVTPDDPHLRDRLAVLERRWRAELDAVLPESLVGELHRVVGWTGATGAGTSDLRIGLAQLEGWLDGVIAGMGFVVVVAPLDP